MTKSCLSIYLLVSLIPLLLIPGVLSSATFILVNNCNNTVWPGIASNPGDTQLPTTGFVLQKGESVSINSPSSWGGRVWGRTHCSVNDTGEFTCLTGDCGSGKLECSGSDPVTPATLAEFKIHSVNGLDFFDLSLVDGYNLPMTVVPQRETGANCSSTGCTLDLKRACPSELKVMSADGEGIACKSACEAFGDPQYCCTGSYTSPDKCLPSVYSKAFRSSCPTAYSYAFDDVNSTFTCAGGADYLITFCPTPSNSSGKFPDGQNQNNQTRKQNPSPHNNNNNNTPMVLPGLIDVSSGSSITCKHVLWAPSVFRVVLLAALWRLC